MKVESVDRTESAGKIRRKEHDNLKDEVEPQKTEQKVREMEIRPREAREGHMDVTA